MNRRTFLRAFGTTLPVAALPVHAQERGTLRRIGWFANTPPIPEIEYLGDAFRAGLRERGYVENVNVAFEYRFGEGNLERYPALAAELAAHGVDLVVATGGPSAVRAMQAANASIPVVMVGIADPVGAGLVASLAHPGGNVTGVAEHALDLIPKQLQYAREALPGATRIAILAGTFGTYGDAVIAARADREDAAAKSLGLTLVRVAMRARDDFERATATVLRERCDALLLNPNPLNFLLRHELAAFALQHRLPVIAATRQHVSAGALMSYGTDLAYIFRKAGDYAGRILGGAKPAELPVEQPNQTELVVNLRTAKALNLTLPQSLMLQVTSRIE